VWPAMKCCRYRSCSADTRLEVLEEVLHELDVVGVGAVGLDVDDDLVVLGPGEALAVIVAGDAEDLLARHAGRLEGAVHGIYHRAAQLAAKRMDW